MARKLSIIILSLFVSVSVSGQIIDPVIWSFGYESIGENQYEIVLRVSIEEGSHIYGMEVPEGGPIATNIRFAEDKRLSFENNIVSNIQPNKKYDEAFEMEIATFEGKVEFRQPIKSTVSDFTVRGYVEYMSCNNISCSPPKEVEFSIAVGRGDPEDSVFFYENLPTTGKERSVRIFYRIFFAGSGWSSYPLCLSDDTANGSFFLQGKGRKEKRSS